ncbi:MAG: transcription antitermination factor NusB [Planctomycetes bacterium]|nr:transcription antitermination factor NusB [Planctomycetota bacterium]
MGRRRDARELALKCLHQWDQRPDDGRELAAMTITDLAADADEAAYCRLLLEAFWANASSIDEMIQAAAENWRLERMAVVDRAVLRLAVTELLHVHEVPARVTLDEAIELAKLYSTEKSGAFVNGILDRILTELEKSDGPEVVRRKEEG